MASPLDSPRFFDDEAHSEWRLGGRVATGPRSAFPKAKAFAHVGQGAPQLRRYSESGGTPIGQANTPVDAGPPASPRSYDSERDSDDAIAIELVRGANGPGDNTWTVVVDGLRYPLPAWAVRARDGGDSDNADNFDEGGSSSRDAPPPPSRQLVFKLPGGVARKKLTPTTRVRPVVVSARLEAEALAPRRVEVAIDQVVRTSELAFQRQPGEDEPPTQLGDARTLEPYRVGDTTAASLLLPYPFWAPAQSALGILSFEPVLRYRERQAAAVAYNAFASRKNFLNTSNYVLQEQVDATIKAMNKVDSTIAGAALKALKDIAPLFDVKASDLDTGSEDGVKKMNQLRLDYIGSGVRPHKKPIWHSKSLPAAPEPETSDTFVIGGGRVSAARELAEMFQQLAVVCERRVEEANADTSGGGMSLRQHLQRIRLALDLEGDTKLRTLFDALFTTAPFPPTKAFLDRKRVEGDTYWRTQYTVKPKESWWLWKNSPFKVFEEEIDVEDYGDYNFTGAHAPGSSSNAAVSTLHVAGASGAPAERHLAAPASTGAPASDAASDATADPEFEVTFEPFRPIETLSKEDRRALDTELGTGTTARLKKELDRATGNTVEQYMFTYDRLALETRSKTMVRTQIRVTVEEYDGTVLEVLFESDQQDGVVAHAVYEQLPLDVAALDYYARRFVDCMFKTHRAAHSSFRDAWTYVTESVRPWLYSKYARSKPKPPTLQVTDMLQVYSFAVGTAVAAGDDKGRTRFPFDEARLEERVIELRLMMRDILPQWPPIEIPDYKRRPVAADLLARDRAPDAPPAAAAAAATAVPPAKTPTLRSVFSKEQIAKYDLTDSEVEKEVLREFEDSLKNNIALAKEARLGLGLNAVAFKADNLNKRHSHILERRLPTIVKPKHTTLRFQMLSNMDPPLEYIPSDAETRRFGVPPLLVAGATAAGSLAVYYGVPVFTALVIMQNTLDYTKDEVAEQVGKATASATASSVTDTAGIVGKLSQVLFLLRDNELTKATKVAASMLPLLAPALLQAAKAYGFVGLDAGSAAMLMQVYENALAEQLLPLTVNVASSIHAFMTARFRDIPALKKGWYLKHRAVMRGKPVASAVNAANAAFKAYASREQDEAALFGTEYREGALYSRETGDRFLFVEYYWADATTSDLFRMLHTASGESAKPWMPVPNGNAMRMLPPPEVGEAFYIAEKLRGLPLTKSAEFTAGVAPALSATSPAALAAKAAVKELAEAIVRQRQVLRGEHLMQSAGASMAQLTTAAATLLRAAYGSNAGFTSVFGEDLVWACLRGGVAARLAVRHLGLFDAAEAARVGDVANGVKRQKDVEVIAKQGLLGAAGERRGRPPRSKLTAPVFWSQPRRDILEQFVAAFLAEGAEAARRMEGTTFPNPSLERLLKDETRRFARIDALLEGRGDLTSDERERILAVPASVMAHSLLTSARPEVTMKLAIDAVTPKLQLDLHFADQSGLVPSERSGHTRARVAAAWASRRVAPTLSREQLVDKGAEAITELLSGISVHDDLLTAADAASATDSLTPSDTRHSSAGQRVYYCPLGSRVIATPGRVPFDVELLDQRLVWTSALHSACVRLAGVGTSKGAAAAWTTLHDEGVLIVAAPAQGITGAIAATDSFTGAARHPLAISVDGNTVRVPVADTASDAERMQAAAATPATDAVAAPLPDIDLAFTLGRFEDATFDASDVAARTTLARRIAFGAERLLFALSFASTTRGASTRVEIRVPTAVDAVACAIAVSMLAVDLGVAFPNVTLLVEKRHVFARELLQRVGRQAQAALSRGCKVCSLAEVAVTV